MKNIKFLILAFIVSMLCVGCGAPNPLALKSTSFTVGLGEEIDTDPSTYLETTDEQVLKDTKFNFKNVDTLKAGVYRATASYDSKRVEFRVEVVDLGSTDAKLNPVISGTKDITAEVGASIDYLNGVTAKDCAGKDLTDNIKVENSAVDTDTPGTYQVTYSVTDASGRSGKTNVKVKITEKSVVPEETSKDDSEKNTDSNTSTGDSQKVDKTTDPSSTDSGTKKETTTKKPAAKPAEKDTQKDAQKPASKPVTKPSTKPSENSGNKDTQKPVTKPSDSQKPAEQEPADDGGDEGNDQPVYVPDDPGMY